MAKQKKTLVEVNISGAEKVARMAAEVGLMPQEVQRASIRAVNRALQSVKTLGARIARETYTAPTRELTKNIRIKKAYSNDASGLIEFSGGSGVPLHAFLPNPRVKPNWSGVSPKKRKPAAGVSTKIKRHGTRKVKFGPNGEKPFWVTTKQGVRGLYYRHGKAKNAIKPLFGPSPIQALMDEDAQIRLRTQGEETLDRRLRYEMQRIAEKMT